MSRAGLVVAAIALATACSRGVQPGSPCSAGRSFEPWDQRPKARPDEAAADVGGAGTLIGFYQARLRRPALPDADCPFQPTCSVFAQQAVAQYGAAGLLLVLDRLLFREHPLAGVNYEETCVDGRWRWRDPVP